MLILGEFKNVTYISHKRIQSYDKSLYPACRKSIAYDLSTLPLSCLLNSIINQIFSNSLCF